MQYVRYGPHVSVNQTPPPAGIAALAMIYIFAAAFNSGWGPVAWVYVSEIPSNRLRAYNVALASFTHWVNNLAVSKATPVMLLSTPYKTYFIFGAINVTMAVAGFWVPETKGVSSHTHFIILLDSNCTQISLERMDELFGVVDMSNIEDVGIAAQQENKVEETLEMHENVRTAKA